MKGSRRVVFAANLTTNTYYTAKQRKTKQRNNKRVTYRQGTTKYDIREKINFSFKNVKTLSRGDILPQFVPLRNTLGWGECLKFARHRCSDNYHIKAPNKSLYFRVSITVYVQNTRVVFRDIPRPILTIFQDFVGPLVSSSHVFRGLHDINSNALKSRNVT